MAMPASVVGLWVEVPSAREFAGVGGIFYMIPLSVRNRKLYMKWNGSENDYTDALTSALALEVR